jgi:hypothetical protein
MNISKVEHNKIYDIVEEFGEDNKIKLRRDLLSLIESTERRIKKQVQELIKVL